MTWVWTRLACRGCGKSTYRTPRDQRACTWCPGHLGPYVTGQFELFPEASA